MASLYSMKPKPFMSLISVISPVPWVWKWPSTSALVALRGRLPRYRRVDETSVMVRAVAVDFNPNDDLVWRES